MIFTSLPLLSAIKKDVLPASLLSNVICNFSCHCDSRYVGRTSQRLQDRIRQHVPKFIRTGQIQNSRNIFTHSGKSAIPVMFGESAIGQHLLDKPICAKNYCDKKFTILSFGLSSFHLSALEAVNSKSCKPNLCHQKEFIYNFKLLRSLHIVTLFSYNQSSPSSFISKSIEFFFSSFQRLSPNECRTKSLEMSFLLAIFKFCKTNHLFKIVKKIFQKRDVLEKK